MICLDGLTLSMIPGQPEILKGVSLELPQGARCVVVGHNGAGKSMLLEVLSGAKMAPPGQVRVCGQDPFRSSSGSKVALLRGGWRGEHDAREAERLSFMKVWQVLGAAAPSALPAEGAEQEPDRATRLQEALGVRPLSERYMGSLSDGERRRVELCSRLREPKAVVLLDEATTDLDVLARRALLELLEAEGVTVLNVTHVFDWLEPWATHLVHIHQGSLVSCLEVPSNGPAPWAASGSLFHLVAGWLAAGTSGDGKAESPPATAAEEDDAAAAPPARAEVVPPARVENDAAKQTGPAVEVRGLKFAYADLESVVACVEDLKLERGARCVLLGTNGSGKSTLMTILAGRRLVRNGDVRVLGLQAFHEHASLDPQVAILSSEWKRQVAELTAGRSLTLQDLAASASQDLAAAGWSTALLTRRLARLTRMLGASSTTPLGLQSDGMLRRAQVVLKLLRPSKLLLLDEVTADLDVAARQALLAFLQEESKAGCTVIYCTHILDGLDGWASHLIHARPGGTAAELVDLSGTSKQQLLLEIVYPMLLEDSRLQAAAVVPQGKHQPGGAGSGELPDGWRSRGAAHAGAFGNHAWDIEQGPEENWRVASSAPPPSASPMPVGQHGGIPAGQHSVVPAAPIGLGAGPMGAQLPRPWL